MPFGMMHDKVTNTSHKCSPDFTHSSSSGTNECCIVVLRKLTNGMSGTIHCDGFWEQKDNTLFSPADDSGRTDNTYNGYNKLLNYYFILLYHSVSKNVFILIVIRERYKNNWMLK
jgi:hypothetical protein